MTGPFATEADLVAAFCDLIERENSNRNRRAPRWVAYHETGDWDLLLAQDETGIQIGIEAKLTLNAKVLEQALPQTRYWDTKGPDYRAVLVPRVGKQLHLGSLADHLGITILTLEPKCRWSSSARFDPRLPDESNYFGLDDWHSWLPGERVKLPDYVPDVTGGKASPVALTDWKVRAIKLLILLDRNGSVTRRDMAALRISASRWTAAHHGFLDRGEGGYVRSRRTPDLRAQHPVNYAEIEADFDRWFAEMWKVPA